MSTITTVEEEEEGEAREAIEEQEQGQGQAQAQGQERNLYLSTIESHYLFEYLRGWSNDMYLEFHPDGKLKQVYNTGKRTEERAKQLGLSYNSMIKLDSKLCSRLHNDIFANRANSSGTEIEIELNEKGEVSKIQTRPVRSFDF